MNVEDILKEIKTQLTKLFEDKWSDFKSESKQDLNQFLEDSKTKLIRWTELLARGEIDAEDFEWLVKSQKGLMGMQALHSAGVNKISLAHFRNRIVRTIIGVVRVFVL